MSDKPYELKIQTEPHRVCQNYSQAANAEMADRIIGIVNPHWRGSVKSTAATQVKTYLDRELTRMWGDIQSFHMKYGLDYGGPPRALPYDLAQFRIKFLQEELDEYASAYETDDTVHSREQMLDALVDLVYVALGTAYLHGFNFAEAWRRVQVANMSKVRVERAEDSKRGSKFDVVKPAGWVPPSHIDLVGPEGPSSADYDVPIRVSDLSRVQSAGLDLESGAESFGTGEEDSSPAEHGRAGQDHEIF